MVQSDDQKRCQPDSDAVKKLHGIHSRSEKHKDKSIDVQLQCLPACIIGEPNHKMTVAGINDGWNGGGSFSSGELDFLCSILVQFPSAVLFVCTFLSFLPNYCYITIHLFYL